MAVHNIIKVEIKQTKINFFCLHLNLVFNRNSLTTQCTAKVCLGEIEHMHHIEVTSHFAYVELRITRSIFTIPLDFEIGRLTCIYLVCKNSEGSGRLHGCKGSSEPLLLAYAI